MPQKAIANMVAQRTPANVRTEVEDFKGEQGAENHEAEGFTALVCQSTPEGIHIDISTTHQVVHGILLGLNVCSNL
jgi:hypothetical protein